MKHAVVVHSGGMDSSLTLALAKQEYSSEHILSLSFDYNQRHSTELTQAKKICSDWNVDHVELSLTTLGQVTSSALIDPTIPTDTPTNTIVLGRNGLMAHLAALYAHSIGASNLYLGVLEDTPYRDCSRHYMDLKQQLLRIDLDNPTFMIHTPLVHLSKPETLSLAYSLGILSYLLDNTITCYNGKPHLGCQTCPSCHHRNLSLAIFAHSHPDIPLPAWVSTLL
ncbi:MAG: 7-cyano-7-deazaguanine synthase [Chlamydiia bacterium]|nr:7-cyano-7-deazaguanine synthase [Chlamydiia bacterium]